MNVNNIKNFIIKNKKSIIGYGICFVLTFTIASITEVVPSSDTTKYIDDSKQLLETNTETVKSNSDEKLSIADEIKSLNEEIEALANTLKGIEEEKSILIKDGYTLN